MVLFLITASLYSLAWLLYLSTLGGRGEGNLRLARWAVVGALAVHLGMIGWGCLHQLNPLRDLRGGMGLTAWLVAAGYLVTTWRRPLGGVLGAFVLPVTLVLLVVARLTPQSTAAGAGAAQTTKMLGEAHIALSALGVATFGLAAAVALLYIVQERALKQKRLGTLFRRIPPLRVLDTLGRRLILVGFPVFTLAVITGVVWMTRLPERPGLRIEYLVSGITWVIFGAMILLRVTIGLRGRRAAWLTVAGFAAAVVVLLIYLSRRVMGG